MKKTYFFLLTLIALENVLAQDMPGFRDSVYSAVLKEKRFLQIQLPADYKPGSTEKYDVTYVLDGEWNIGKMSYIQGFVRESGFMPQCITVAIINVNRNRDLTPSAVSGMLNTGGADNFLAFLKDELIPYIDKTYPTNRSNTLFGHSFGGLFAMYAFLKEPQLFDTYLAADPSLWWETQFIQKMAAEKLDKQLHSGKTLWITGRGGRGSIDMGIPSMDSVLRSKAPSSLHWKIAEYPGETHNSIVFKTLYDGLRFAYTGYNSEITYHPMNGIVVKDKPLRVWVFNEGGSDIRYTTDGSDPGETSPQVQPEISLAGPAELTLKSFSFKKSVAKTMKGQFKQGQVMKSMSKPKNAKPGGVRYYYYEGEWDSLPDFKKLKPLQTGVADSSFRFGKLPSQTNFAVVFEGFLEITDDGYHVFGLNSDDGAKFYIGNQLVIDFDGLHGMGKDRSYVLPLEKGFYPMRLEYFQRGGGLDLSLIYVKPGTDAPAPRPIPPSLQYYQ